MIDAGIAIVGGILVGLLIRSPLFAQMSHLYDDADLWEVAGENEVESASKPSTQNASNDDQTVKERPKSSNKKNQVVPVEA